MEKLPMTAGGLKGLQDELKHLKNVERHAVIKAISEAREHGDLSENAEYHAARERQGFGTRYANTGESERYRILRNGGEARSENRHLSGIIPTQ